MTHHIGKLVCEEIANRAYDELYMASGGDTSISITPYEDGVIVITTKHMIIRINCKTISLEIIISGSTEFHAFSTHAQMSRFIEKLIDLNKILLIQERLRRKITNQ